MQSGLTAELFEVVLEVLGVTTPPLGDSHHPESGVQPFRARLAFAQVEEKVNRAPAPLGLREPSA